jgi:hypothetical protein
VGYAVLEQVSWLRILPFLPVGLVMAGIGWRGMRQPRTGRTPRRGRFERLDWMLATSADMEQGPAFLIGVAVVVIFFIAAALKAFS